MAKLKIPRSAVMTQLKRRWKNDPFFYIGLQKYKLIGPLARQGGLWLIIKVGQNGLPINGAKTEKRSETEILVDIALYENYLTSVKRTSAAFLHRRQRQIC